MGPKEPGGSLQAGSGMVLEAGGAEARPHTSGFRGGTKVTPLNGTLDGKWEGVRREIGLKIKGDYPESEGTLRPRVGGQN